VSVLTSLIGDSLGLLTGLLPAPEGGGPEGAEAKSAVPSGILVFNNSRGARTIAAASKAFINEALFFHDNSATRTLKPRMNTLT